MNIEDDEQIHELLSGIPEQLQIFKRGINPQVQQAYLEYATKIGSDEYTEQDTSTKGKRLFDPDTAIDEKKKCLISLAHAGTVDACLTIREFLETSEDEELVEWGVLALEEGWLLVESDLFEKPMGMVMTGLGGEEERLRYFFAVGVKERGFPDTYKRTIEQAISLVCGQFDAVLEEVQIFDNYVTVQILIPMDVAVAKVIEGGIIESNRAGEWLGRDYFVTNSEIPSAEQILQYLQQAREQRGS